MVLRVVCYNHVICLLEGKYYMPMAVKLSDSIVSEAQIRSKAFHRSVAGQIEYWAKIGKIAEENPDLTFECIKDLLIAQQEVQAGRLEAYRFSKK